MAGPLDKTFEVLATSSNVRAVELLIRALDSWCEPIRERAARALLRRRAVRGYLEVVRHLRTLSPAMAKEIAQSAGEMSKALERCVLEGDEAQQDGAYEIIRIAEAFDEVGVLLTAMETKPSEVADKAARTLRGLVYGLYDHLHRTGHPEPGVKVLRNPQQIRHGVLVALDNATAKLSVLYAPELVVEAILILGDPQNFAVRKVLSHGVPEVRDLAARLLVTNRHPGVMQLLLDFLALNCPHPRVLDAIQMRDDPEFACHVLRWMPRQMSTIQQKNLRQIEQLPCFSCDDVTLGQIPPGLHESLVRLLVASNLPHEEKVAIQSWLLCHGSHDGRTAASDLLDGLDVADVQSIVVDGLISEEEEVQAWATSQLRSTKVPETFPLLIAKLDSDLPAVREAARRELESFDMKRLLGLFEELTPRVRLRAMELVRKVDPEYAMTLRRELADPVRSKRIRAARAALALNLHHEVASALFTMLEDSDTLVRRTGVEVCGHIHSVESRARLKLLLDDANPRIREEAAGALAKLAAAPGLSEPSQSLDGAHADAGTAHASGGE